MTGAYDVAVGWFKPGLDRWDQRIVAVVADTPDRIIIGSNDRTLTLAGYPLLAADGTVMKEKTTVPVEKDPARIDVNQLLVLDGTGRVVENWSQWNAFIAIPHSLAFDPYDPERHLWVVDRTGQQILKFTRDGVQKFVPKAGADPARLIRGEKRRGFDYSVAAVCLGASNLMIRPPSAT